MSSEKMIIEILDRFNFERVAIAMEALDWTYRNDEDIPTIGELQTTARYVLQEVLDRDTLRVSTGGFVGRVTKYKDYEYTLSLDFVVTDWEVNSDEIR